MQVLYCVHYNIPGVTEYCMAWCALMWTGYILTSSPTLAHCVRCCKERPCVWFAGGQCVTTDEGHRAQTGRQTHLHLLQQDLHPADIARRLWMLCFSLCYNSCSWRYGIVSHYMKSYKVLQFSFSEIKHVGKYSWCEVVAASHNYLWWNHLLNKNFCSMGDQRLRLRCKNL